MLGPTGWKNIPGHDLPLVNPDALSMTADDMAGQAIYDMRCDKCHGDQGPGQGRYEPVEPRARVPALWGGNSFTKGAQGMYTAPLLAHLIKKFMPLGDADLTDQEALDVAGYVVSQPHDMGYFTDQYWGGLDPVSGTIPNYLFKPSYFPTGLEIPNDPFTFEQRLLGPWQPIEDWQAAERALY
jgi:thiosulfate dehydrogenase